MKDPMLKVKLLIRSELALARIQAKRTAYRTSMIVVALLFGLFGLGILNVSIYFVLSVKLGPALAALFLALGNLLVGLLVLLIGLLVKQHKNEERIVREIRDLASDELGSDLDATKEEITKIVGDVRKLHAGFSGLVDNAASGLGFLTPLINLLTKKIRSG